MNYKNILDISNEAICTGCGACAGICKSNAISMQYTISGYLKATLDENKCYNCGNCRKVCPSVAENDFKIKNNILIGEYIECYAGYVCDHEIRRECQSGGVITALIMYLLEKNLVESAIVSKLDASINKNKACEVTTAMEALKCSSSCYMQSAMVEKIFSINKKKIVSVVLGCQAEAIKLASDNGLKSRPEYIFGLMCGGQFSRILYEKIVKKTNFNSKKERLLDIRLRDKKILECGWPGEISVKTSKREYFLSRRYRHKLKKIFESPRCLICFDKLNIFSDIVFGDPYGIPGKEVSEGFTAIIVRTEKGERLLKEAEEKGIISLEKIKIDDILKGQSIFTVKEQEILNAYEIFTNEKWLYPYNSNLVGELSKESELITRKEMEERLKYTRGLYTSLNKRDIWMRMKIREAQLLKRRGMIKINKVFSTKERK